MPRSVDDLPLDADELVRRFLLKQWLHEENFRVGGSKARRESHVLHCPDLRVTSVEGDEDINDTGAVYTQVRAHIECPHGTSADFHYSEWGSLDDLVGSLDALA